MKLGITIQFCADEAMFLPALLEQCAGYPLTIAANTHFFDGEVQDLTRVYEPIADRSVCVSVPLPEGGPWVGHAHNRWAGFQALPADCTHILFLDADEIPEGARLKDIPAVDCATVGAYTYWREPTIRCDQPTQLGLLLARQHCTERRIKHTLGDRKGMREGLKTTELFRDRPLVHHYSWVRPLPLLLKKVARWGHKNDRPWQQLIDEHWSRPFGGRDFLKGSPNRTYSTVRNQFDIRL